MAEASWRIFQEQYPQLMKLMRELGKTDWYARDGWSMFIGHYHAGAFVQLYKPGWHNHTLDGVHVEFGLDEETLAAKELRIDLHIGHANVFDRARFNELTLEAIAETVAGWGEGYQVKRKTLSDRANGRVRFTKTGFAKQVSQELGRWQALGPIIDAGLAGLDDG